jgi:hypothetical protein
MTALQKFGGKCLLHANSSAHASAQVKKTRLSMISACPAAVQENEQAAQGRHIIYLRKPFKFNNCSLAIRMA